jgi:hypothetical protein
MEQQIRLVYTSVVRGAWPSYNELANLLRVSRDNNAKLGVTGVLCYANGVFLQALEGDRDVVNRLYGKISHDRRHADCQIVVCKSIERRSFADWSMQLVAIDHALLDGIDLKAMTGPQAEAFLGLRADEERRRAA